MDRADHIRMNSKSHENGYSTPNKKTDIADHIRMDIADLIRMDI